MTECKAYLEALRILGRSDRSVADLIGRLKKKQYPDNQIQIAVNRCQELGYLDDEKLANTLARTLTENGRAVGRRLRLELKKRGIPTPLAEQVMLTASQRYETIPQLVIMLQRRFPQFDPRVNELQLRRRVIGFFQRRGYRLDDIYTAFKHLCEMLDADPDTD